MRKPFCFKKLKSFVKQKYNVDFEYPEKMVMIGDRLTTDMAFGNLNKM